MTDIQSIDNEKNKKQTDEDKNAWVKYHYSHVTGNTIIQSCGSLL